jgi:DNA (cytosine-5)-methyltransferase 1
MTKSTEDFLEQTGLRRIAADFFAGMGLVSLALSNNGWEIGYALDHSGLKRRMYEHHFGVGHYHQDDIKDVHGKDLPQVTLAHASFPCTDTSVAGSRGGLDTGESSTFWQFVRILAEMGDQAKPGKPPFLLIENVEGFLTSGNGNDLRSAIKALNDLGYTTDLLLINASHFVPQSRVRLFIIGMLGVKARELQFAGVLLNSLSDVRPEKIRNFINNNDDLSWFINDLPKLPERLTTFEDIIDQQAVWWPKERAYYLFSQMFERHKREIRMLFKNDFWTYGTVFRRMRLRDGIKQSTAELRLDGIAGCLRTPKGGSARQIVIRAGKGEFNARLLNARECAYLMGAEAYKLDEQLSLNDALFGFGDSVCVPVVEWIIENCFDPLVKRDGLLKRAVERVVTL